MDLTNLTTITKSSTTKQNFDLRYSKTSDRFQVSDRFFASKDLNNNGFKFHLAEGGKTPLISIHPHEDAVFFKGKESSDQKNPVFSYSIMTDTLKDMGMIGDDKHTEFALEEVGEQDGVSYYRLTEWEATDEDDVEEASDDSVADNTAEIVDTDDSEEEADVEVEAEVEEDPFA